jgi:hypothetical protein
MVDDHYPFIVVKYDGSFAARTPNPFASRLTAEHPPAWCLCSWTWTPSIGGREKPFAMKFWNRACPVRHQFPHPAR